MIEISNITLPLTTISIMTPNGTQPIIGYEHQGTYPNIKSDYSIILQKDKNLLHLIVFPLQYNIDNKSATAHNHVNIFINTELLLERKINASVQIKSQPTSLVLQENENASMTLEVYSDFDATVNATNITVICEIPDNLDIISTDGDLTDHKIEWIIKKLTTSGVESLRLLQLTVKAPEIISTSRVEEINCTVIYSDESNNSYEPTSLSTPIHLISPSRVDIGIINIAIPEDTYARTPVTVSVIIQNIGDTGLTNVPVTLSIDNNWSQEQIIEKISAGENVVINYELQFTPGIHVLETVVQPIEVEYNTTDNIMNKTIEVVCMKGDFNCDGIINRTDYFVFEGTYKTKCNNPLYDSLGDFDDDCDIDIIDFIRFGRGYGV